MAFLYPDKTVEELSALEMVEDVLLTQNKIETDLRAIIARIVDMKYGDIKDYHPVEKTGVELVEDFLRSMKHFSVDPPAYMKNIDIDLFTAWKKYEHFQLTPFSDIVVADEREKVVIKSRVASVYRQYNQRVMPYYGFFILDNEQKYKVLFDGVTKEFSEPEPLTKEIFEKLKYKDIIAMTYCGYGAMGEEGVIWVIDKDLHQYGVEINTFSGLDTKGKIKLFHGAVKDEKGMMKTPRWWAGANTENIEESPIYVIKDAPEWYGMWTGGGGNYVFFRKKLYDGVNSFVRNNSPRVGDLPFWLHKNRFRILKYAANYHEPKEEPSK